MESYVMERGGKYRGSMVIVLCSLSGGWSVWVLLTVFCCWQICLKVYGLGIIVSWCAEEDSCGQAAKWSGSTGRNNRAAARHDWDRLQICWWCDCKFLRENHVISLSSCPCATSYASWVVANIMIKSSHFFWNVTRTLIKTSSMSSIYLWGYSLTCPVFSW